MKKELGIFILLVVLCAITAIMNPRFLAPVNLQNTARLIGAYGLLGLGLGAVIITGGIDLSVGSVLALLGVLLSMAVREWGVPGFAAVSLVIGSAIALGWLHGFLVARVRIQPFIVTLCGLLFYRGLARFIADDETKGFGDAVGLERLQSLATGNLLGVPMPFVLLIAVSALMWVLIHRSVYGRYLFAVGNNEDAARYSGINSKRMIASAYIVCAALAGVAAVIFAFYTNSVSPSSHGNFFELYGIAAAVLGGCSLRGGEGSVVGILLGTALLQVLQNLVNLLGIPSSLNFAVMGAVILIGVLADQLTKYLKGFYVRSVAVGLLVGTMIAFLGSFGMTTRPDDFAPVVLLMVGVLLIIYAEVVFLVLLYKAWACIQDGYARTTPGKAVGFLFIPIFGVLWVFRAIPGFADDYNLYIDRTNIPAKRLTKGALLALPILSLLTIIPKLGSIAAVVALIVECVVAYKLYMATNALVETAPTAFKSASAAESRKSVPNLPA